MNGDAACRCINQAFDESIDLWKTMLGRVKQVPQDSTE